MKPRLSRPAMTKKKRPRTASTPSSWSTPRPRRLPRKWLIRGRSRRMGSMAAHGGHDAGGHGRIVFLLRDFGEDAFKRGRAVVAQFRYPAVSHHFAAVQDHDAF